jgi:hypothetical protein
MKNFAIALLISIISFISVQASAEPAVVVRVDGFCEGFIPDPADPVNKPPLGFWTGDAHIVGRDAGGETFPGSGKLTCQGYHDVTLERSLVSKGFTCFIPNQAGTLLYITENTIQVATPSGNVSANCNFDKKNTLAIPAP